MRNRVGAVPLVTATDYKMNLREKSDEHHGDGHAKSPSPMDAQVAARVRHFFRLWTTLVLLRRGQNNAEPASRHFRFWSLTLPPTQTFSRPAIDAGISPARRHRKDHQTNLAREFRLMAQGCHQTLAARRCLSRCAATFHRSAWR